MRLEKQHAIDREEFELVRRDRNAFDQVAWASSVAHRLHMPTASADILDPGPDPLAAAGERTRSLFLADSGEAVRTRPAKAPQRALGFVTGVSVGGRDTLTPGTLLVRVDREAVEDVDPRTLHLFRWDVEREAYEVVQACGLNVDHGYVWGRITRPGTYVVFGLPLPRTFADLRLVNGFSLGAAQVIISRVFVPDGDWASLGPRHLSCCILDLAIERPDGVRLYAAASDGGLWRLDDVTAYPSQTWVPITDAQPSLVISCMAVSPADPDVVLYVDNMGLLYRSGDRGSHWALTSSTNLSVARRLIAHPVDINRLYVASASGLWASGDSGTTWATLRTGDMTDLAIDPGDPSVLFLAQRGIGILRSADGGMTWQTTLSWNMASMPAGTMIKVAVGGQGTTVTRTVVAKLDQEVFVNRNGGFPPGSSGGGPWGSKGKQGGNGYGDWCHVIAVDPFDDDVILAGAQELYRTHDGGSTWTQVMTYYQPHEDQHRIVFDPGRQDVVYAANDGGVFRSTDAGVTWRSDDPDADLRERRDLTLGLVTTQFFTSGVSGEHAIGNAYHQGLLGASHLTTGDWEGIEGHSWELANIVGDPVRHGRYYVFTTNALFRRNFFGPSGDPALAQIGTFVPTALAVDEKPGSATVLVGTSNGQVMRAPDGGNSDTPAWTAMAGIFLGTYDSITALAFARPPSARFPGRLEKSHAFALSAGGRLFECDDVDSGSFSERTSLPTPSGVAIAVAVEDERLLFAGGAGGVFRSHDSGATWTAVPGTPPTTLPPGMVVRSLATGPGTVYLATASGIFRSQDVGQHWFPYHSGLPNVEIKELLWTENDLFAVTQGRGLWHHGRYDTIVVPAAQHAPDIRWIIELWLAIHGGDPAPNAVRQRLGRGFSPAVRR